MTLADFVRAAMTSLDAGVDEIPVGRARALQLLARLSPSLALNIVKNARA